MMFEWMYDPSAWAGLATLVALEIVLGIDNLVFIAILADKLPPKQREKARLIGLSLALLMRLALLASIAWMVTLTEPLFTLIGLEFSGRDLILLIGGFFLLFKGTMELHERLEGSRVQQGGNVAHAIFWQVLVQIVVLDAVFSLDSVITAVGMVDELMVMMTAVVIAMVVMMVASKPLMTFVSRHPTVVILCLGFLMMIGFSLILDGFGFKLPKGYLYAAIGFSILIEAFNQAARRSKERLITTGDLRDRTAIAVLTLLGGRRPSEAGLGDTAEIIAEQSAAREVFAPEEKEMIQGVLTLAERPVKSIMTPRNEIDWLNVEGPEDHVRHQVIDTSHSRLLLARVNLDDFIGVALTHDLLRDLLEEGHINLDRSVRQPLVVHESVNTLRLMEQMRKSPLQMAIVLNEYGALEGIATPIDILEAIAGEFPDDDEVMAAAEREEDGSWRVDGSIDVRRISNLLGVDLVDETDRYATLAGYIFWRLGHLPKAGQQLRADGLVFEVVTVQGRNIDKVLIKQAEMKTEEEG
jgi:CBS domain containing-hemolysin-like protein